MTTDRPQVQLPRPDANDPTPTGPNRSTSRRRRLRSALLVIAALVLVVATGLVAYRLGHRSRSVSSPTAPAGAGSSAVQAPTSRSAAASPAAPALLPHGQEAPRSAVPWDQVDEAWQLSTWSETVTTGASPETNPRVLYLVNPIGGRYRLADLRPGTVLELWSPDRRRAILQDLATSRIVISELDLVTGATRHSFLLGNRHLLGYTRPVGLALLFSYPATGAHIQGLQRLGLDGNLQQDFPGSAEAVGEFNGAAAFYRADGAQFVIGAEHGLAVLSNTGSLVRTIAPPAGTNYCFALRLWNDDEVLAACSLTGATPSPQNLYRASLTTGTAIRLTSAVAPDYGFTTAWPDASGIVAQRAASCGGGELVRISSTGVISPIPLVLVATVQGPARLLQVVANHAIISTGSCGPSERSLLSLDLASGVITVLLGPGLNGGTVW